MVASMVFPAKGGFSFDLCARNGMMDKSGPQDSRFQKDWDYNYTRAIEGPIVADKNCEKIHYMAPIIYCCREGTAADTEAITGHVNAALVLGVECTGPHLHTVYPHGSTETLPFVTMGSGSLAAMSVFEAKYKEGLTREQAIKLVSEAVCAGIFNDLATGSSVDVCVITKGKTEYLVNHQSPNPSTYVSSKGYSFAQGQTEVLSTKITPLRPNTGVTVGDAMED